MTTIGQAFQDNQINASEARDLLTQAQQRLTDRHQLATPEAMTAELTAMIRTHEATLPSQNIDEEATARAIVARFGSGSDTADAVSVSFTAVARPARPEAPARGAAPSPAATAAPASRIDQQAAAARREFEAASQRLVQAAGRLNAGTISATVRTFSTSLRSELGLTGEVSQNRTSQQQSEGSQVPLPDASAASGALGDTGSTGASGGKDNAGSGDTSTSSSSDSSTGGTTSTGGGTQGTQGTSDGHSSATATLTAFRAGVDRSRRSVDIPNGAQDARARAAYLQALTDFAVSARQYLDAEALRGIRSSGQGMQELQELGILDTTDPLYSRSQVQAEMDQYRSLLTPVLNGLMQTTDSYNDLLNVIAASAAATMSGSSPIDPNASASSGSSFAPTRSTSSSTTTGGASTPATGNGTTTTQPTGGK
jgi:hypothetical protein